MTLDAIRKIVQQKTGVVDLSIRTKTHPIPFARWIYFYMARRYTYKSLKEIGDLIGYDHASVLHGIKMIKTEISTGQFFFKDEYHIVNDFITKHLGEKEYRSIEHSNEYFELWKKVAS